jgi:hypothetical protein
MAILLIAIHFYQLKAQSPVYCPVTQESLNTENASIPSTPDTDPPCFKIDEVFDNCSVIYLRINFHFFLDDNCNGLAYPSGLTQEQALVNAENLVNEVNSLFANNQDQINSTASMFKPAHCIPIRLLLSGVYIHCNTSFQTTPPYWGTTNLQTNFGVNINTEINYYVSELLPSIDWGNPTGIGFSTTGIIDWLEKGNLIHEFGHTLSLFHSWTNSFNDCAPFPDDTPPIQHDFDYNCINGIEPSEKGKQCGEGLLSLIPFPDPNPDSFGSRSDRNNNGIHDCDETEWCPNTTIVDGVKPCCLQVNQNNNIMSYGYPKSAFTESQIKKMLLNIKDKKCKFIEKIAGCPPPSAFINILPKETKEIDCLFCLNFDVSQNETSYRFLLYNLNSGSPIFVYASPFSNGNAGKVCFMVDGANGAYHLKPSTKYRINLYVKNDCGDGDTYSLDFTTPSVICNIESVPQTTAFLNPILSPNPLGDENLSISFNLPEKGQTWIYAINLLTGKQESIGENIDCLIGEQTIEKNVSSWRSGTYAVWLIHPLGIGYSQFIKL